MVIKDIVEMAELIIFMDNRMKEQRAQLAEIAKLHSELLKMMNWDDLGWDIPEEMLEKAHQIQAIVNKEKADEVVL